jgi:hypothetical protein
MNYLADHCKGNLDAATRRPLLGANDGWIVLYTYIICFIFLRNDTIALSCRKMSLSNEKTKSRAKQYAVRRCAISPAIGCKFRRSGRAAGHKADWKRVDRLIALIERGPFDLDDSLRF